MAGIKEPGLCPITGHIVNGERRHEATTSTLVRSYSRKPNVAHVAPLPVIDNSNESSDVEIEFIEMYKSDQKDPLKEKLAILRKGSKFRNRARHVVLDREPQVIVRTFDFPKLSPLNAGQPSKLSVFPKPKERWKYQHDIVSPKNENTKESTSGMPKSNCISAYNNMILPRNHSAVASSLQTSSATSLPSFTAVSQTSIASKALQSMAIASKEVKFAKVPSEMLTTKSNIGVVGGKYVVLKSTSPSPRDAEKASEDDAATVQKLQKSAKVFLGQSQCVNKTSRSNTIIVQNNKTLCKSDAEFQTGKRVINPFDSTLIDVKPVGLPGIDLIDGVSESQNGIKARQDAFNTVLRNNLLGAPLIKASSSDNLENANTIHLEILAKDASNFIHSTLETSGKLQNSSQSLSQSQSDAMLTLSQAEQRCRVARERVRTIALHGGDNRSYRVLSVPNVNGNEAGEMGEMIVERPVSHDEPAIARTIKTDPILAKPAVGDTVRFSPALGKPVIVRNEMGNTVILRPSKVKPVASREREVDTSGLIMQNEKSNPVVVTASNTKSFSTRFENDEGRMSSQDFVMKTVHSAVDVQVADVPTRQNNKITSTSPSYASQLSAALLLTEKAQASARAAGDSQKLKKLQDEMAMLQVRHTIALQYQRDVEKERSECPVFRIVNHPARQVVLVDSSCQTTLFSLLEPGRMVEMTINKSVKNSETKQKNSNNSVAEEVTLETTPTKNSNVNTNNKSSLRPKHVVSVDSSGQIMAVTTTPNEQPLAKRAKLDSNVDPDTSPIQISPSRNVNIQNVVPVSQASDPPKNINMVIMVKDKNNVCSNVNKFYISSSKHSELEREHNLSKDVKSDHKGMLENCNDLHDVLNTSPSHVDNHQLSTQDSVHQLGKQNLHQNNCNYNNSGVHSNSNELTKPFSPSRKSPVDNQPLPKPEVLKKLAYQDWLKCKLGDASGNIPLHLAVMDEDINQVKRQCFVLAALKKSIDIPNNDHETPLHLAVLNGSEDIVSVLLDFGAKANVTDSSGNTALHLAAGNSSSCDCLKALLNKSPNVNKILDSFNDEGFSALHLCALNNKTDEVAALICKGADINIRDGKSGRTALFHATECNHAKVSRILLVHNASTSIPNFAGHTPLLVANELSRNTSDFLFASKTQQDFTDVDESEDVDMEEESLS